MGFEVDVVAGDEFVAGFSGEKGTDFGRGIVGFVGRFGDVHEVGFTTG